MLTLAPFLVRSRQRGCTGLSFLFEAPPKAAAKDRPVAGRASPLPGGFETGRP
jgi:hypothetical protein